MGTHRYAYEDSCFVVFVEPCVGFVEPLAPFYCVLGCCYCVHHLPCVSHQSRLPSSRGRCCCGRPTVYDVCPFFLPCEASKGLNLNTKHVSCLSFPPIPGDTVNETCLCAWYMKTHVNEPPNVGGVSVRSRNGAPSRRDACVVVKRLRQATNELSLIHI